MSYAMTQMEALILFKDLFNINDEIEDWFPNGQGSVRIRLKSETKLPFNLPNVDIIFTAKSSTNWKLETVEAWIDTMKMLLKANNLNV